MRYVVSMTEEKWDMKSKERVWWDWEGSEEVSWNLLAPLHPKGQKQLYDMWNCPNIQQTINIVSGSGYYQSQYYSI